MEDPSQYTQLLDNGSSPAPSGRLYNHKGFLSRLNIKVKEVSSSLKDRLLPADSPPPPQSGYLTLIPLSDSRLQPPRTKAVLGLIALLSILSASAVFFLVPRGVSVGTIEVHSHEISFNRTQSTYQIVLSTSIPVYNPNWLPVQISGTVNVSFYDQEAGHTFLNAANIPRRAQPEALHLRLDASSVPKDYLLTIFTQCFTFPRSLIFFLKASLKSEYMGTTWHLPKIDNYFMINCNETKSRHEDSHNRVNSRRLAELDDELYQGEVPNYKGRRLLF